MKKDKGFEDLQRNFVGHPLMQHKRRFSASEAAGSIELGWYRGKQCGIFDAYKTIRDKFPKAADYLLKCNQMNKRGDIVL